MTEQLITLLDHGGFMKFLVISDLHQKKSRIPAINSRIADYQADFTVFLGDVTDSGTGEDARSILSEIKSEVYVIPGNSDPRDMPSAIEGTAHDMHGKGREIMGRYFAGLGGSNITIFGTPFELTEDELYDGLKAVSREGMVLMTHVPSHGILDEIPSGLNVGSPAVKRIVEEFRPILAMSGHVHEAVGVVRKNGTVFLNPGPARDGYSAVVEIDGDDVRVKMLGPRD